MSTLSIQYISDLHIDLIGDPSIVPKVGDVLVLAGGIGNPFKQEYRNFIHTNSLQFEAIFLIAGNHEFYAGPMEKVLEQIRKVVQPYPNVHFLHNTYKEWKGIRFCGSPLWSDLTEINCEFTNNNYISKKQYMELHTACIEFISTVANTSCMPVVVISYHLPTYQLINVKNEGSPILPFIVSNCEHLIRYPIVMWIYGQYQENKKITFQGVQLASNGIGYPGDNTKPDYDRTITLLTPPLVDNVSNISKLRITIPPYEQNISTKGDGTVMDPPKVNRLAPYI